MQKKTYSVDGISSKDADKGEPIIKQFIFKKTNIVRFTHNPFNFFDLIFGKRKQFLKLIGELKNDLIKKEPNKDSNRKCTYYYYNLSTKIKNSLEKISLLTLEDKNEINYFTGFTDPTFYKDDELIVNIILNAPLIMLHINKPEKTLLEKKGVKF